MDKLNGILLSQKKCKFESVLVMWMNLESVIQSEVSQKEKNKYRILTRVYGIYKNGTDEHICRAAVETPIWRTDLWTRWGKETVGQIESSLETYIIICKIDSCWECAL